MEFKATVIRRRRVNDWSAPDTFRRARYRSKWTIIALALIAIAIKLWAPANEQPTLGDLYGLAAIPDPSARQEKARELFSRIPLAVVRVQGTVDAEVMNDVNVKASDLPGLPGLPGTN